MTAVLESTSPLWLLPAAHVLLLQGSLRQDLFETNEMEFHCKGKNTGQPATSGLAEDNYKLRDLGQDFKHSVE